MPRFNPLYVNRIRLDLDLIRINTHCVVMDMPWPKYLCNERRDAAQNSTLGGNFPGVTHPHSKFFSRSTRRRAGCQSRQWRTCVSTHAPTQQIPNFWNSRPPRASRSNTPWRASAAKSESNAVNEATAIEPSAYSALSERKRGVRLSGCDRVQIIRARALHRIPYFDSCASD